MNEIIKEQNKKDLKRYRLTIAAAFVSALVIALIVGISTMNSFVVEAKSMNAFLAVLMPDSIEGTSNEGQSKYTYGMVFYREKNKDYDPLKDEPIKSFNYYYKDSNGERIDLKDGVFYPADYYNKEMKVNSVPVYAGFYLKALEKWNVIKKVLNVVVGVVIAALVAFGIWLWYISWRRREIVKRERLNK